jgi:tyrosyl-tRNA synthetase
MLAASIVRLRHGIEAAAKAWDHFQQTVQKKEVPENIPEVSAPTLDRGGGGNPPM